MAQLRSVRHSIINVVFSFVNIPVALLNSVLIARMLGPTDKGIYNYISILSVTVVALFLFGTGGATVYYSASKKYDLKDVFFTGLMNSIMLGLLIGVFVLALFNMNLLGESVDYSSQSLPWILFLLIVSNAITTQCQQQLTSQSEFVFLNIAALIKALLMLLTFYVLLVIMDLGLTEILIGFVIINLSYVLTLMVKAVLISKPKLSFNTEYFKKLYTYGIRVWMGNIANRANSDLDQFLLGYMTSAQNLGIYSTGYRISGFVNLPIASTFTVFFNKIAQEKNEENRFGILSRVHRIYFFVSLIFLLALMLAAKPLVLFLYGEAFAQAALVLWIVVPGILFYGVTRRLIQKYLQAIGKPLYSSYIQTSGLIGGAIAYIILIPPYGLIGASVGTTIAFTISSIISLVILAREENFKFVPFFILNMDDISWLKRMWRNELASFRK